jgi:ubiquinone/menaquinone biosynthesis C-methylase UbiE
MVFFAKQGGSYMPWFGKKSHDTTETSTERLPKLAFTFREGRRYSTTIPYVLPCDERESQRMDFEHHMVRAMLHQNYIAPLERPAKILDVGCGIGRWAVEMAAQFPEAAVIGVDLVPPQPDSVTGRVMRRDNFTFVQSNILEGLPFPNTAFDYVHMRFMSAAIPITRWNDTLLELVRVTRSGGWIELCEFGQIRTQSLVISQMFHWITLLMDQRGLDLFRGPSLDIRLRQAGLDAVQSRGLAAPVQMGQTTGRLSTLTAVDLLAIVEALRPMILAQRITTPTAFAQVADGLSDELSRPDHETALPIWFAWGRRIH